MSVLYPYPNHHHHPGAAPSPFNMAVPSPAATSADAAVPPQYNFPPDPAALQPGEFYLKTAPLPGAKPSWYTGLYLRQYSTSDQSVVLAPTSPLYLRATFEAHANKDDDDGTSKAAAESSPPCAGFPGDEPGSVVFRSWADQHAGRTWGLVLRNQPPQRPTPTSPASAPSAWERVEIAAGETDARLRFVPAMVDGQLVEELVGPRIDPLFSPPPLPSIFSRDQHDQLSPDDYMRDDDDDDEEIYGTAERHSEHVVAKSQQETTVRQGLGSQTTTAVTGGHELRGVAAMQDDDDDNYSDWGTAEDDDEEWKGWMVCEWSLGHPQLFWLTSSFKDHNMPQFCERVRVIKEVPTYTLTDFSVNAAMSLFSR